MASVIIFEDEFPKNSNDFLRVTQTVEKLKALGFDIQKHSYNRNDSARRTVEKNGVGILPMTFVNNFMMISKRYPTDDELRQFLNVPSKIIEERKIGCCCIPGYEFDE